MIKFILGMVVLLFFQSIWRCFTDKPSRKYYVRFKDNDFVPAKTRYLDNGKQHTSPFSFSWNEEYKEDYCYFYSKKAAKEALRESNLKEEHQAKIIKGPKTKSPACKLKQRMYNWLKKEC